MKRIAIFLCLCGWAACGEEYTPRPAGYFRLDLPEKKYVRYTGGCPFTFDYPAYARPVPHSPSDTANCWMNIEYPSLAATIHLSYFPLQNDLRRYMEDSRTLAYKHTVKAEAIDEESINRKESRVYGLVYHIRGNQAASPVQFCLTDSMRHFLRGALYFQVPPPYDSLAPVIFFVEQDIGRFIETLQWK